MATNPPPPAVPEVEQAPPSAPVVEQDETWEEKEDKLDAENIKPGDLKYKYKEGKAHSTSFLAIL